MKKIFLITLIFIIVSISITGILIQVQTKKIGNAQNVNNNSTDILDDNFENTKEDHNSGELGIKLKTLDLNGTYNENDLEIKEIDQKIVGVSKEISIPIISGLKNKNVENKINEDIKKRIISKIEEILKQNDGNTIDAWSIERANFSNVISIYCEITYKKNNDINTEFNIEYVTLNYELVNGEKIKFEDLFVEGIDVRNLCRQAFYRGVSANSVNASFWSGTYYDKEDGKWKYDENVGYDEENGTPIMSENEYIPEVTEYDVSKMIQNFITKEQKFYFTPAGVTIVDKDDRFAQYNIDFADIPNDVVIYDKYLTEENLYESTNIGLKNLWTCSEPGEYDYFVYGLEGENLFYQIELGEKHVGNTYPFIKNLNILQNNLIQESYDKLEEYKTIAKQNPDKFYVLDISIYVGYGYNYSYYNSTSYEYYNLFSSRISERWGAVDIQLKDLIMTEIIDAYRTKYGDLSIFSWYIKDKEYEKWKDIDNEYKIHDARSLEEVTSISQVFRENVDYMSIIKNKAKELLKAEIDETDENITEEELNQLIENFTYTLTTSGISFEHSFSNHGRIFTIHFKDIDKSLLTVYDIELYILPESNSRKLEEVEIKDWDLDKLNKAYNEIFARHGHEFKNKELKEYFEKMSWYQAIENKTVSLEELNEIEKYNLEVIKSMISKKKL